MSLQLSHTQAKKLILVGPLLKAPLTEPTTPIIAIDGGIRFCTNPVLWIGDGDSGPTPTTKKENKNESDLSFCLKKIREWNYEELHLYGFLGARKDHELANFGEIYQSLKVRPKTQTVFFDHKIIIVQQGAHSFEVNNLFSVFSFEPTLVSISGDCEFKLEQKTLAPFSSQGLSNIGRGTVAIQSTAPLMITLGKT